MRLTFVFVYLLIFGGCLVVHVRLDNCGDNEYPVTGSPDRHCFPCASCHPGYGLEPKCGTSIKWKIDKIGCKLCTPGTYNDKDDSSPCQVCHNCAEHEIVTTQCTNKSDTICSGTCMKGYFFAKKDATHSCQKCSYCCFDGDDEEVSECANQGLNANKQHCSPRPDKDCSPVASLTPSINQISGSTEASKSDGGGDGLSPTTIYIGVISAVVVIALVVPVIVLFFYCRKKKMGVALTQQPIMAEEGNGRTNINYSSPGYASNGPQAEATTDTKVDETLDPKTNPDSVGTPHGSQAGLDKSMDHGAAANQSGDKVVKLRDVKKSGKPPLKRQCSQDSQNSGDGEVGFRRRSSSTISFEKLKWKLSERDKSLLEEEADEIHETIKIDKQPQSQKQKEGSRVEFKFKVQGHNRLLYQWIKDGIEVLTQNNATLVLECIELRDFGCYTCKVSYQDGYGEIVSSGAVLDVIPQCRNGMRPKRLQEVDLDTRDEIACLLESKRYSLGGCRQVAAKYNMKEDKIGALDNSKEPGKDVMEFLMGSKPDLTVYSFCKILKEDKIKRFDIVKLLEDHLLIREGAAATYL